MENTALITYREAALLIDAKQSSLAMKQRVAQVVSHEVSHQWVRTCMHIRYRYSLQSHARNCAFSLSPLSL